MTTGKLSEEVIRETLKTAYSSARKRANHVFTSAEEPLQHIVNAWIKGSYLQPHRHENPDKEETLKIIKGKIAVFVFGEKER